MSRLATEFERLYGPFPADAQGRVRALVFEVAAPADWSVLAPVAQAVQEDLDLPAPAIAVSGTDGLQLWFSCAEAVTVDEAQAFLEALRVRYLSAVKATRVRTPTARPVPREQADGNWSAFIAPGLAPVFADTPWLDIPPSDEGQADLLAGLRSASAAQFAAAMARLVAVEPDTLPSHPPAGAVHSEPATFLLQVMNDPTVPLALRIEAAKALMPRR